MSSCVGCRKLRNILVLTTILAVVNGCSNSSAPQSKGSRGGSGVGESADVLTEDSYDAQTLLKLDPGLDKLSIPELQLYLKQRKEENAQSQQQLLQFNAQNIKLCQELNSLRQRCIVSRTIMPTGQDPLLQCSLGDQEKAQWQDTNIEVELSPVTNGVAAPTGDYVLIANNNYWSNPIRAGRSKVTFEVRGYAGKIAPAMREIFSLQLRRHISKANPGPSDYPKMPSRDAMDVKVYINGKLILGRPLKDVAPASALFGRVYLFDLEEMFITAFTDDCKLSESYIQGIQDSMRAAVTADFGQHQAQQQASLKQLADRAVASGAAPIVPVTSRGTLLNQILQAKIEWLNREPVMKDERSRALMMINELRGGNFGCKLNQPVQAIEVKLHGAIKIKELVYQTPQENKLFPESPKAILKGGAKPASGAANTGTYTETGAGVEAGLNAEPQEKLTVSFSKTIEINSPTWADTLLDKVPTSAVIGDLQQLVLSKGGVAFENELNDKSNLINDHVYDWLIYETDIYTIDGVDVTVIGPENTRDLIYSGTNLGVTLNRRGLSWWAPDFRTNDSWIKLMAVEDCPVSQ